MQTSLLLPLQRQKRVNNGDHQHKSPEYKSQTAAGFAHFDDGNSVIVVDNGSGSVKAGFAGEDSPISVFPSVVGYSEGCGDYYIGQEAENRSSLLSLE